MTESITKIFESSDIKLSKNQAEQLNSFMQLVLEQNKKTNLTAITHPGEFIVKHLLDSALGAHFFENDSRVLDLGSGAGFPGLVLSILNPSLKLVLVDSVRKKVDFLNLAIKQLNLKNVSALHIRAEDYAKQMREKFDFVTSRAVANLSTLLEYSLPFLKNNGKMIVYKGPDAPNELKNATNALKILGGRLQNIIQLNIQDNQRNIIIIQKVRTTPSKYPRGQNLPRKSPLN